MGNIPLFTELDDKARKSPLGYGYFNALALNELGLDDLHVVEHLDSGEHNAAEIARLAGRVRYNAGYTLEGFNGYASLPAGHNPAVGTLILTVTSGLLDSDEWALQACNQSETGLTAPCITTAYLTSTTTVEFHSFTSTIGSVNTWAAEDCNFSAAVCSRQLVDQAYAGQPIPSALKRGDVLTQTNYNNHILTSAALRTRQLTTHVAGGTHSLREVAKAYGHITGGATYTADSGAVGLGTITRVSRGIITVALSPSLTTPLHVFVQPDYPRATGPAVARTLMIACAPRSVCVAGSVEVHLYGYSPTANDWEVADADFFIAVHGA